MDPSGPALPGSQSPCPAWISAALPPLDVSGPAPPESKWSCPSWISRALPCLDLRDPALPGSQWSCPSWISVVLPCLGLRLSSPMLGDDSFLLFQDIWFVVIFSCFHRKHKQLFTKISALGKARALSPFRWLWPLFPSAPRCRVPGQRGCHAAPAFSRPGKPPLVLCRWPRASVLRRTATGCSARTRGAIEGWAQEATHRVPPSCRRATLCEDAPGSQSVP